VLAAGAARGNGWPAREKLGRIELSRSLEWFQINKQKIQLLKHGKSSPKSEGTVIVIV
jgi:hypothetical protein